MSKVTIEDISRQTGLSRGTVSRALNDRPDISEQTKQRVLDACRQLNYVPSQAARSLATGRNFAVAVVVDSINAPTTGAFLRGVMERAERANYTVSVLELGTSPETRQHRMNRIVRERVDAMLVTAELEPTLAEILRAEFGGRPVSSLTPIPAVNADVLTADDRESGRITARHLVQRAGTNIVYVHDEGATHASERLDGFREAAGSLGVDLNSAIVTTSTQADLTAIFDAITPRLNGIVGVGATTDALAVITMLAACRVGRTPGHDIAIMGQGNDAISEKIRPRLTTVDLIGQDTGQRALDIALQRLGKTRMDAPEHTRVAPTLLERESTNLTHG